MIKLSEIIKKTYSGVLLDKNSRDILVSTYISKIPMGWTVVADHMTINPFGLVPETGIPVMLKVTAVGKNKTAFAVKVMGYEGKTNNKFAHITIAVDKAHGGKAKDSNDITEWSAVNGINLTGTVENL